MRIDYGAISRAGGLGKGTPRKVAKAARTRLRVTVDERESAKVRVRSGGRCEVVVQGQRCSGRAFEVHHQMGGFGVRGRGKSALARNKTHACSKCHHAITGNVLQHIKGQQYRRAT